PHEGRDVREREVTKAVALHRAETRRGGEAQRADTGGLGEDRLTGFTQANVVGVVIGTRAARATAALGTALVGRFLGLFARVFFGFFRCHVVSHFKLPRSDSGTSLRLPAWPRCKARTYITIAQRSSVGICGP